MAIQVDNIDHLVLTVKDITVTVDFYATVLGMKAIEFGESRIALSFGQQKINLARSLNLRQPMLPQVPLTYASLFNNR